MLTLTTLALDLLLGRKHRDDARRAAARTRRAAAPTRPILREPPPLLCFEVLVPYVDPTEARRKGVPLDTRLSMLVRVWAVDAAGAQRCAGERFNDLRLRRRGTPRLAEGGPVVLRVVQGESRAA